MLIDQVQPAELDCERSGAVAVLRINRPRVRNALGAGLVEQLRDRLGELDRDPSVAVAVLAATGPGFCAGSDLKELAGLSEPEIVEHEERAGSMARTIGTLDLPVLAAVEGFAMGGGFLLATSCDLVISGADCRWQLPEARLGWIPPWGLASLVERAGTVVTRRLVWTGEEIDGTRAAALGIADEAVAPGRALATALDRAARLARTSPHPLAGTKRALRVLGAGRAEELDTRTAWWFAGNLSTAPARASLRAVARTGTVR